MSPRKLSRKGKLDQDLPFREPKTFAIFPKCFDEWEFFGYVGGVPGQFGMPRTLVRHPLVSSSIARRMAGKTLLPSLPA